MHFSRSFVGFPFASILRNSLRFAPPARAALWLREDRVSALFTRGRRTLSLMDVGATPGAPLLLTPARKKTAFAAEVLRPNRMERDGCFAFVVEQEDAIVSLVQTKNLAVSSIGELCSLPVETLLPTPTLPDSFLWQILSPELEALPASGALPSSVVVVGLSQKVCWWAEKWVESVDGILLGVWPSLLAILHWCRLRTPAFALLPGKTNSYVALFVAERLHLLTRLPAVESLSGSLVEPLVEEIRRELQIPPSPLCIYPGDLSPSQIETFLKRFQQPFRIFGPQPGSHIAAPEAETAVLQNTLSNSIL
jgi:hypothetical protein